MNRETLGRMSAKELDEYAAMLGISAKASPDAAGKVRIIEEARSRTAAIRVLGIDFDIPIKRAHDQRVASAMANAKGDEDMYKAMELLLGPDQMVALTGACTDEDGTVDVEAMALAYRKLFYSPELKNF